MPEQTDSQIAPQKTFAQKYLAVLILGGIILGYAGGHIVFASTAKQIKPVATSKEHIPRRLALFTNQYMGGVGLDSVFFVVKDSTKIVDDKVVHYWDTTYGIGMNIPLTDSAHKKLKTKDGKDSLTLQFYPTDRRHILIDFEDYQRILRYVDSVTHHFPYP